MSKPIHEEHCPDDELIDAFAARLEAYAASLSERERDLLKIVILRAIDPVERMRWRDTAGILDPAEEAVLRELEAE